MEGTDSNETMRGATCHVYVDEKWFDKLLKIRHEQDILDITLDDKFNRLSCQIFVC